MNIDKNTLETIRGLYTEKEQAVIREDFDEAKRLKTAIDRLKAVSTHLGVLEERKKQAIASEDYDSAKVIKAEIDKIKKAAIVASSSQLPPI